jgi:hypothetical protein
MEKHMWTVLIAVLAIVCLAVESLANQELTLSNHQESWDSNFGCTIFTRNGALVEGYIIDHENLPKGRLSGTQHGQGLVFEYRESASPIVSSQGSLSFFPEENLAKGYLNTMDKRDTYWILTKRRRPCGIEPGVAQWKTDLSAGIWHPPAELAWIKLGCPGKVDHDSDADLISDQQETCLANYYSPVLILHQREEGASAYWPSSAEFFLSGATLGFDAIYRAYNSQNQEYFPTVRFGVVNLDGYTDADWETYSDLVMSEVLCFTGSPPKAACPADLGPVNHNRLCYTTNISCSDASVWSDVKNDKFYLFPDESTKRGIVPSDNQERPPIYTHVYPNSSGGINIQYWYFFPYNGTELWHQGDWEHITLKLDQNLDLKGGWYSQHGDEIWRDYEKKEMTVNPDALYGLHPEIYIARDSHASYWTDHACDKGGAFKKDECPEGIAWSWFPYPGEASRLRPRPLYSGGGLKNLGERDFEHFLWARYGGHWGSQWGGFFILFFSWQGEPPPGPLFQGDDRWLKEAAQFLTLPRKPVNDPFEPNASIRDAQALAPGSYMNMTLTPEDNDYYKIHVAENYSDLTIDLYYDKSSEILSAVLKNIDTSFTDYPVSTPHGVRFRSRSLKAGDYFLEVSPMKYPFLYPSKDQTAFYDMVVSLQAGSLPSDRYEDNDSINAAKMFFNGCEFGKVLNIDKVGDDDYYYINVTKGDRVTAEIEFDPAQGELQLFMDSAEATNTILENSHSKKLSISRCVPNERSILKITGDRNWYNMCVSANADPVCGYESAWQIFDDFTEPLSGSQWIQSIAGTAIINAGSGTITLDASASTGPYTYPRGAVVNSTQEFTSGAFRFVGIQEEVDRLWFVGLDNGQGTYILVRRDHPENRNLEFAVYSNYVMIDLLFFDPPIQPPTIDEITILWSDYNVDVVVKVDSQTQYTHHVDLPEILAPMPIKIGAYTSSRLIIDDIFISE